MLSQSSGHQLDSSRLLTYEQTLEATRQQTKSQRLDPTHTLVGHEDGSDLLIFMMETGPAQALDVAQVGGTLPGVGPLYSRSFVAEEHYTTHPYSSDAMYSILSGLYPQGRRRLLRGVGDGHVNALMTALQTDVPVRRVYVPSFYDIRLDARMYAILGAESVYAADEHSSDPMRTVASQRADALVAELGAAGSGLTPRTAEELRSRLLLDFQTLARVKADITEAARRGQRYAVLFFPEIGHGPWLPLRGEEDVRERGRALMLLQDAWLKELVDTIRGLGRLERTVIALTADHGIRTRAEDPALQVGRISDFMFRVPLLDLRSADPRRDLQGSGADLARGFRADARGIARQGRQRHAHAGRSDLAASLDQPLVPAWLGVRRRRRVCRERQLLHAPESVGRGLLQQGTVVRRRGSGTARCPRRRARDGGTGRGRRPSAGARVPHPARAATAVMT